MTSDSQPFVLVHPAWHGAWLWEKVVPLLRAKGHLVSTPTLTGLGERSHLARPDIGLEVHVADVVDVLNGEDLRDVVLVGHMHAEMARRTAGWRYRELEASHHAAVTMPETVADLLLSVSSE